MKKTNILALSLLAMFALSGVLSLAAAQDVPDATPLPPDVTRKPILTDSDLAADSSVTPSGADGLYTIQGNATATDNSQVPEAQQNQVAPETASSDNATPIVAAAIAVGAAVGTVGVVFYRKKA